MPTSSHSPSEGRSLPRSPSIWRALVRELRPHQWAKNALVFAPLLLSPEHPSPRTLLVAALGVLVFSLVASSGYVLNDLLDLEADRAHATKRDRPFASGALPTRYGPPLLVVLLGVSFGVSLWQMPLAFTGMLAAYWVGTMSYSLWLKSMLMVDVLMLAWLYTHRILAGGVATQIPISAWLLAVSMFLFLSLAFQKRYIELRAMAGSGPIMSRGYDRDDIEIVRPAGLATGYMAVLVFCLYLEDPDATFSYTAPQMLWAACPVLVFWISHMWFRAHRGQVDADPVRYALKDRTSWICGLIIAIIAALARYAPFR